MSKKNKKNIKVRDLNPKKDAKGGSIKPTGAAVTGSPVQGAAVTGSPVQGTAATGIGKPAGR